MVVGELAGDRVHVLSERRLVQPGGQPLPPTAHVVGRGADLHVLLEDSWLRLDVDDL
ncbi:hypothetical protein [Lentzea sp. NPDC060358]|uniref:hypothetical protein n=1 Tax=Lentzea sp. NPDC060358 TaxID=3347103 RepID=UPI00366187A7